MLLYFVTITLNPLKYNRLAKPAGQPTFLVLAACYSNAFKVMVTKYSNIGYWALVYFSITNLRWWIWFHNVSKKFSLFQFIGVETFKVFQVKTHFRTLCTCTYIDLNDDFGTILISIYATESVYLWNSRKLPKKFSYYTERDFYSR